MNAEQMIANAIAPMFAACGNSYINAWLQEWLESAKAMGVYEGPVTGTIAAIEVDVWVERAFRKTGLLD